MSRGSCVGISCGGAMGSLLAGVGDRFKAHVIEVGDGGLVTHFTGPEDRKCWLDEPGNKWRQWVAWMWPIEPTHNVGWASPAALLFQNGPLDAMVAPATRRAFGSVAWPRISLPLVCGGRVHISGARGSGLDDQHIARPPLDVRRLRFSSKGGVQ